MLHNTDCDKVCGALGLFSGFFMAKGMIMLLFCFFAI